MMVFHYYITMNTIPDLKLKNFVNYMLFQLRCFFFLLIIDILPVYITSFII
jgi:hypothetical protein